MEETVSPENMQEGQGGSPDASLSSALVPAALGGAAGLSEVNEENFADDFTDAEPAEITEAERERELAKTRAERAWNEFKSMVYARSQMDNSIFVGPGHAEMTTALGNFRLFKTIRQSTPVFSSILKLNLLFFAMVIFFLTFQLASSERGLASTFIELVAVGRLLPAVIISTVVLALLAGILWLSQRPKRLMVLPNMLVMRTDINADIFSELIIPWQSIERVELANVKFLGSNEVDTRVEIFTSLGVKHWLSLDDLLVDNSEASFINAVRTWAPWAARNLTFSRGGRPLMNDPGARLTELWLHQFNTAQARQNSGMLAAGEELSERDGQGEIVRTYKVLGIIGGGGQGNTYLAAGTDTSSITAGNSTTGSAEAGAVSIAGEVVLKEYIMPVYRGSTVLARLGEKLADEANLLARLDHPLVVKVLHHFVHDYRGYLVLEYVEGRSLKELVIREGPQPEAFVLEVGKSLLSVLHYMHRFDPPIVHRDLSPDNIMLSVSGEIKVVDFNVARQLEGPGGATVVGKHAYIPPEQFRGRPTPASDLYALGGTLHFLLTGRDPEPLSVSHPKDINSKITGGLDEVIARATALELKERYNSASEMLDSLAIFCR